MRPVYVYYLLSLLCMWGMMFLLLQGLMSCLCFAWRGGGAGTPWACGPGSTISYLHSTNVIFHYAIKFTSSFILSFTYLISNLFNHLVFTLVYSYLTFLLQVLWLKSLPSLYSSSHSFLFYFSLNIFND